jgi:DNA modification methylase
MKLLESSIDKVGVIESISVATDGTIISGHARKEIFDKQGKVAKEIKLEANEYPVILTGIENNTKLYFEAQILANTTANRNFDLDIESIDIIAEEFDIDIEEIGVEVEEPDLVIEAKEDDFDATPPTIPITVLGDLYEIGEHRLLCGDSTCSDTVAKLMNGSKADMVFTDPPYNVAFNGRSGKFDVIKNDDLPEGDFENLINGFVAILEILKPNQYYVWCNWKFYGLLQSKLDYKACIVWAKNVFGLGRGYRHQHEFCLFNGNLDDGINNETDLWEIKKDSKYMHPTQKPIELASRAFSNHKKSKNIVDLFCGSGSTIVAAHQLKRKCYGMELDPKYCDVIVKRMIKLDDKIKVKRNGIDCTNEFKD